MSPQPAAGDVTLYLRTEQREGELPQATRASLPPLPAEDFPRLPEVEGDMATPPPARWPRRSTA